MVMCAWTSNALPCIAHIGPYLSLPWSMLSLGIVLHNNLARSLIKIPSTVTNLAYLSAQHVTLDDSSYILGITII